MVASIHAHDGAGSEEADIEHGPCMSAELPGCIRTGASYNSIPGDLAHLRRRFECQAQVSNVPHSSFKGYTTKRAADMAFAAAQARGLTFACGYGSIATTQIIACIPLTIDDLPICLAFLDDETSLAMAEAEPDHAWYVVFRGTQPGIYRTK